MRDRERNREHYSLAAEASVIGAVLNDAEVKRGVLKLLGEVGVEDFVHPSHQAVWQAIRNCEATGMAIDITTVSAELARMGRAQQVGGAAFVAELTLRNHPIADNAVHYAKVLMKHRTTREVLRVLSECQAAIESPDNADDEDFEGPGALRWSLAQLGRVQTREGSDGTMTIGKLVQWRVGQLESVLEDRMRGVRTMTGIPTGVEAIDEFLGGYQIGIVTVVAARPRMGKSSLMRVAAAGASKAGHGTHTFSVEDHRARFADRVLSSESKIPAEDLRAGHFGERGAFDKVTAAAARMRLRNNWLVDDSSLTAMEVVRRWRRHGEANATKLVCVDYLQRLRKRDYRMSDFEHVAESMDVLADAAKQDDIAVLVGSQLNRECEKRENRRPQLADMRAGGPIEEIAKCILGMYRGCVYGDPIAGEDYAEGQPPPSADEWARRCEINFIKNSDGREGRVFVTFDGPTTNIY